MVMQGGEGIGDKETGRGATGYAGAIPENLDKRQLRPSFYRIASVEPATAMMEAEVAIRLFGAREIGMSVRHDAACVLGVQQVCRRLCIPLVKSGSGVDPNTDGLVLGHWNLGPNPGNLPDVEPGGDVSDTIRRLCNHLTPGVHNH